MTTTVNNDEQTVAGMWIRPTFSGDSTYPIGIIGQPTISPSGNISLAVGFQCDIRLSPGNGVTITTADGGISRCIYSDVAGAVTTGITHAIQAPVVQGALQPDTQYGLQVENQGAAGMDNAVGLYVAAQSGATSNWVFELPADATDPTGGGGAATGRIKCLIGGATRYIPYY
jgi:hypothetical protein